MKELIEKLGQPTYESRGSNIWIREIRDGRGYAIEATEMLDGITDVEVFQYNVLNVGHDSVSVFWDSRSDYFGGEIDALSYDAFMQLIPLRDSGYRVKHVGLGKGE